MSRVFLASKPLESVLQISEYHNSPDHLVFDTWQEAKDHLVSQSRSRLATLRTELMREQALLSRLQAMQPPTEV